MVHGVEGGRVGIRGDLIQQNKWVRFLFMYTTYVIRTNIIHLAFLVKQIN